MKAISDRVLQVIILIVATGLTIYFDLSQRVHSWLPSSVASHIDEKTIIPVVSGLVYVALFLLIAILLRIPILRRRMDKKFIYTGKYLSLPRDANAISIFEIKTGLFDTKYSLVGHSYSLSDLRPTGGWDSHLIDMKPGGRLTYIYSGHEIDQSTGVKRFDGHGYAEIQLSGQNFEVGSGSWVDDDPKLERKNSRYVKLTRANARLLKDGQGVFKRFLWVFVWRDRAIVGAFNAMAAAISIDLAAFENCHGCSDPSSTRWRRPTLPDIAIPHCSGGGLCYLVTQPHF
jgi:hypothetical protein